MALESTFQIGEHGEDQQFCLLTDIKAAHEVVYESKPLPIAWTRFFAHPNSFNVTAIVETVGQTSDWRPQWLCRETS